MGINRNSCFTRYLSNLPNFSNLSKQSTINGTSRREEKWKQERRQRRNSCFTDEQTGYLSNLSNLSKQSSTNDTSRREEKQWQEINRNSCFTRYLSNLPNLSESSTIKCTSRREEKWKQGRRNSCFTDEKTGYLSDLPNLSTGRKWSSKHRRPRFSSFRSRK